MDGIEEAVALVSELAFRLRALGIHHLRMDREVIDRAHDFLAKHNAEPYLISAVRELG